jgi:hypothetical protein
MQQCGSFIISLTMPKTLNLYMNLLTINMSLLETYELVISKLQKHKTPKKKHKEKQSYKKQTRPTVVVVVVEVVVTSSFCCFFFFFFFFLPLLAHYS